MASDFNLRPAMATDSHRWALMTSDGAPHQVDELLALGRELKVSPKARDPPEITSLSDVVKLSEDDEKPIRSGYQNEAAVQVLADLFNLMDTAEPDFDVGGEQL
jgi:hypothetical protein